MKKNFKLPIINIRTFKSENIVTNSILTEPVTAEMKAKNLFEKNQIPVANIIEFKFE